MRAPCWLGCYCAFPCFGSAKIIIELILIHQGSNIINCLWDIYMRICQMGIDNQTVVSSFFSAAFCLLAYSFLISFNLCRHFWAIEKVFVDSFFTLKLKSVKISLFSCFLLLSKMISLSSFAHSLPSASIASRVGINADRSDWTALRFTVYFARFASWTCLWLSLLGSAFSLKCSSCLRNASTIGPSFASYFFKFW